MPGPGTGGGHEGPFDVKEVGIKSMTFLECFAQCHKGRFRFALGVVVLP